MVKYFLMVLAVLLVACVPQVWNRSFEIDLATTNGDAWQRSSVPRFSGGSIDQYTIVSGDQYGLHLSLQLKSNSNTTPQEQHQTFMARIFVAGYLYAEVTGLKIDSLKSPFDVPVASTYSFGQAPKERIGTLAIFSQADSNRALVDVLIRVVATK